MKKIAFLIVLAPTFGGCSSSIGSSELSLIVEKLDGIERHVKNLDSYLREIHDPDLEYIVKQIASLSARRAGLLARYTKDAPEIKDLEAQILELENRLQEKKKDNNDK